ncbi:DNA polymerase III subunit delta' [Acidomonas methanolica]|nr:DNA polymerase III subunit delta' [Acidomonas methanolica]MCQ9154587.1 DNA polymerase III subunit delta' [Acidomonas methanolica]
MSASPVPSPRETTVVLGHEEAEARFRAARESGRLHHAWLLTGPPGIGKATLAFRLARLLLDATEGAAARRVSAGTHGDLLVIARSFDEKRQRARAEIVLDDVRPLQSFLHHTAAEGGWRVVILDGAEYLNRSAANAVLKLLEEPPERTVIFLVTSAPGALLPTIRSRCRRLALTPLDENTMEQALVSMGYDRQEIDRLLPVSHGAPGRAVYLGQDHDGKAAALAGRWLNGGATQATPEEAERILRQDDGFALLCDLLGEGLIDRGRLRAARDDITGAARAGAAYAALMELRRETERFNLDKAQATLQAAAIVSES